MAEAKRIQTPADRPFTQGPKAHEQWTREAFDRLIDYAWGFRMSDIKLIPNCPPYVKVYGKWYAANDIPVSDFSIDAVVAGISGSESMPSRVRGGEFMDFAYEIMAGRGERRRFRCNATGMTMPGGITGISLVLRTIPGSIPTLQDVALVEGRKPSFILRNMFPSQGIVLFTGPTGSGKTTTLAAGIGYLLRVRPDLSVETYEDPVEFDYRTAKGKGPLIQVSVAEHLHGDFQRIAPNAARRSSDVVIVGETRDRASFRGLIQLADMGMLTISTLHTRSVAETPSRILNTFPADEQPEVKASLIHGLRTVVQQRLLPSVDGRRVAVREYLAFSEKIRYELSCQKTEEMIPFLRTQTAEHGQLLINDVYAKYREGIIDRATFKRMEAEHEEASRVGGGGDGVFSPGAEPAGTPDFGASSPDFDREYMNPGSVESNESLFDDTETVVDVGGTEDGRDGWRYR